MLHLETVEPSTLMLLRRLQRLQVLADTRLVGGTALALQLGHRTSVDLDIFGKWDYSEDLFHSFSGIGETVLASRKPDGRMQFFFVNGVKVDCVSYERYAWLEPPVEEDGVRLAGIQDIAAMKINAITNRGTRKDFVDVARLMDNCCLSEMFKWYLAKYKDANPALAVRSLSYFEDAEAMPMPKMLMPFDWEETKRRILSSVRQLVVEG